MYTKIVQNIDLGNGVTVNSGNCLKRGVNVFSPGRNSLSYFTTYFKKHLQYTAICFKITFAFYNDLDKNIFCYKVEIISALRQIQAIFQMLANVIDIRRRNKRFPFNISELDQVITRQVVVEIQISEIVLQFTFRKLNLLG